MDAQDETRSHSSASTTDEEDSSSLEALADQVASSETEQFHTHTTEHRSDSTASPSLSALASSVRGRRPGSDGGIEAERASSEFSFDESDSTIEFGNDESNMLLVGPAACEAESHLCGQLMTPTSAGTKHHRLSIFIDTPLDAQLDILRQNRREGTEQQTLIDAGRYTSADSAGTDDDRVDVLKVTSSRDLRRIGLLTTKVLLGHDDDRVPVTVCFHSLSNLVDAVDDDERVFRFLHILLERIRAAGGHAHFHFDPASHDEQIVRTFFSLFDSILEFDADGSVSRQRNRQ
jgi:hypothetical protein